MTCNARLAIACTGVAAGLYRIVTGTIVRERHLCPECYAYAIRAGLNVYIVEPDDRPTWLRLASFRRDLTDAA